MTFAIGDTVLLNTPENPYLDRTRAVIRELTDWGAHVFAEATATKQFRALFSEMTPLHTSNGRMEAAVESGYTGEVCSQCGSLRMRRAGSCQTCEDCGSSSGCG